MSVEPRAEQPPRMDGDVADEFAANLQLLEAREKHNLESRAERARQQAHKLLEARNAATSAKRAAEKERRDAAQAAKMLSKVPARHMAGAARRAASAGSLSPVETEEEEDVEVEEQLLRLRILAAPPRVARTVAAAPARPAAGAAVRTVRPAEPRVPEVQHRQVLTVDFVARGEARVVISSWAAGFVLGPEGVSMRALAAATGTAMRSTLLPERRRTFTILGSRDSVLRTVDVIHQAVERFNLIYDQCTAGFVVSQTQVVDGVSFLFKVPHVVRAAAARARALPMPSPPPEPTNDARPVLAAPLVHTTWATKPASAAPQSWLPPVPQSWLPPVSQSWWPRVARPDDLECVVCMTDLHLPSAERSVLYPCAHDLFCGSCAVAFFRKPCPLCRSVVCGVTLC